MLRNYGSAYLRSIGFAMGDIDWLGSRINIERAIVAQHVDATKTHGSKKTISIARELLERLRLWLRSDSAITNPLHCDLVETGM